MKQEQQLMLEQDQQMHADMQLLVLFSSKCFHDGFSPLLTKFLKVHLEMEWMDL